MELKPGYKQTEVGVIPEDWEVQPLLSAVRIASGQVSPKIEPYKSMILVAPDHIESSTGRLLSRVTAADQGAISGKYLFGPGDILYSKIRPYLCKATIAHFSGLCSADMYPLAPAKGVSSGYMLAVILGHRFTKYAESVSVRSGMPKINREELSGFSIPIPPDQEQIRIAETLGDVDQLLDLLEGLIAKKQGIKQAAMQELLTGKRRLPGFEGEWEVKRLGDVGEIKSGGTPSTSQRAFWDGGIPWCTPTDITALDGRKYLTTTARTISPSGLQASSAEIIPPQSLIMTTRATIGECAINTLPMTTNQGFKNIVPSPVFSTEFLYYLMSTQKQRLISLCGGSTFLEIGKKELSAYEIRLPLDRAEQDAISSTLSAIDDELQALETSLGKAENLKQGMMQQLLTGKIRLQ
jgi:type I restriction enzyme S subunit